MEISTRTKQLKAIFSYDKKVILEDQPLEIRPYHFIQNMGVNAQKIKSKFRTPF